MSRIDESRPFIPVGIAVLTVSDTRTLADDRSGDTLVQRLGDAGHRLARPEIRVRLGVERQRLAVNDLRCAHCDTRTSRRSR